ncbi:MULTISPECIES: class II fructose-bisphosphatase [Paraclostridium]|uniref:Fructose-1,6-bisphosphatase n=2 Tax=Paraclostridium bifermentans TaxID=1490 RepID=A0A5P3XG76_PARBF|nr:MULTISPECIES: class II fructose-bisphosphatase [Paraclostridium]KGJ48367.1 fructose 1,6-bisphosphatase [Clostridium sp. NCR]MDV8115552.1 class II fructose-bisphosphatase [Bacillus sp. BAU-SS-2023]EQK40833.1 fructose-1,6-bisphosphatase, class II [[Clostridium] bifermentans ATCC 638] [Paraclostridium bifermentans ATCC 638 = DSM 14991]EQK44645.1 fructose-1,6-bisphosphatase, class II [[Clostridium] bifermentans ATCC 19299] [Paraclostridium bifermentans ATCC 19299]MBN8049270.1 class II fructose-
MDRNLALELVRVTEAAALVSSQFMGRGDKNGADGAAVEAMRRAFETVKVDGEVVIGEGELDEAPMLYIGEKVGMATEDSMKVDIAVDPLDGTTLIAKGLPNVISVIAMGKKGSLLKAPDTYMKKIIVGPKAKGCIDLNASVEENIKNVAKALNKKTTEMTIIVQDRERHDYIFEAARKLGTRIKMFGDGDVAAGIATCFEDTGIDMLMGIGGGPEGVITAAAIKCMGGDMQAQIYPLSEQERIRCHEMGLTDEDISKVLSLEDLAQGDELFFAATGITDGDLLKGVVSLGNNRITTNSVVMRAKTGTIRFVDAIHSVDKNDILTDLMGKYSI